MPGEAGGEFNYPWGRGGVVFFLNNSQLNRSEACPPIEGIIKTSAPADICLVSVNASSDCVSEGKTRARKNCFGGFSQPCVNARPAHYPRAAFIILASKLKDLIYWCECEPGKGMKTKSDQSDFNYYYTRKTASVLHVCTASKSPVSCLSKMLSC